MQCPKCGRDYNNTQPGVPHGNFTKQNNHDHRPFRQFGYSCGYPDCGFHATVISVPVDVAFNQTGRTYEELDRIVIKFRNEVEEFYKKRKNIMLNKTMGLFSNE